MKLESDDLKPRPAPRWVRVALGISLGLNLLLLSLWALRFQDQSRATVPPGQRGSEAMRRADVGIGSAVMDSAAIPNTPGTADRSTPWSRLVSTNFLEFADRLRKAGCPHRTVCDILTPQIRATTWHRRQEALHAADFWAVGAERRRFAEQADESLLRLDQEEARLKDALGCSNPLEELSSAFRAEWVVMGFLEPSRLRELAEAVAREWRWVNEQEARTGRVLLPEERSEIMARRARFREELGRWISPGELEELKLRTWVLMGVRESESEILDVGLSGSEFREYCRMAAAGMNDLVDESTDYGDLLGLPESSGESRPSDPAIRQLFGEERYRRFRQAEDSSFGAIQNLARESGQDPDLVQPAFDVVERLRSESIPEVRRRWTEDPDAGLAQLRSLRNQVQDELRQQLGALPEDQVRVLVRNWLNTAIREGWSQP